MAHYDFVADLTRRTLLSAFGSTTRADTPQFVAGDKATFALRFVQTSLASGTDTTPLYSCAVGATLAVAVGTAAGVIAQCTTATYDSLTDTWNGTLNLDTAEADTFLSTAESKSCFLEIELAEGSTLFTAVKQPATLINGIIDDGQVTSLVEDFTVINGITGSSTGAFSGTCNSGDPGLFTSKTNDAGGSVVNSVGRITGGNMGIFTGPGSFAALLADNVSSYSFAVAVSGGYDNNFVGGGTLERVDFDAHTKLYSLDFRGCTGLKSIVIDGCTSLAVVRFCSTATGVTAITITDCNMSASALNTLFGDLPTVTSKTITVHGNPGAATCTTSIATGKGWTVVTTV